VPLSYEQISYIPAMTTLDVANNRIYAMDSGPCKVVGINFNQKTGNMSLLGQLPSPVPVSVILSPPTSEPSEVSLPLRVRE
jgi:hypothetical protein